jgi:eukaryotic-like serine/threonine-protein kinase
MASADRLIEVFNEAKALPTEPERQRFVAEACADDPGLKQQVLSLLQAHDGAANFLQPTPLFSSTVLVTEKTGDRIGRYKLLQKIGEGGCGVVYMAEQEEPVRRRVAFKVIKLGMDTKQVVARFEAEGQALALMDHPNIAKVFDAGATNTGRPYFVMELVRGIKITDYCDQKNLPTEERLKLFTQVCHAIQHAHQKGIIHRDIKPSNILVTVNDGVPLPKVIDFGIAKATTDQRLTDKTVFTAFEQFIGTPAYMSPEQAEMTSLDIDTRADIYSLGVLLYELLSGNTPFDAEKLVASGVAEIRRIIREQEPPKPSTRLNTLSDADQGTVALHRHTDAPKLIHLLRGDLDWIVMKCLEKDRTRRYETANGLAMDLQRHLDDEPIIARPPSNFYRFHKLVRRHKLAFAATSAVVAALVIGLGISTWMFFKERQAHQRAVAAEQDQARLRSQAEAEAAKSQQLSQFFRDTLYTLNNVLRDRAGLQNILDSMAARIGTELKQQPEVEAQLSSIIGRAYGALGDYADAERMFRKTLALYQKLHGNEYPGAASMLGTIASMASFQGRHAEAETLEREALALLKKQKGEEDMQVASTLDRLAMVLLRQSRAFEAPANQRLLKEAETLEREALRLLKKLFGDEGTDTASSLGNLSLVLSSQGKPGEAETMMREALAIHRKLHRNEHWTVAMDLIHLGDALVWEGKFDEADPFLREGLAMRRRLVDNEHPDVAYALSHLATLLLRQGKFAEAEIVEREARAIYSKQRTTHPHLIGTLGQLVQALRGQGKLAEAETFEREKVAAGETIVR